VTERPILFSGAMVRAILDSWKTQTRRVVKPQPKGSTPFLDRYLAGDWESRPFPYGRPGDRLWVRETWYCDHAFAGDYQAMHEGGRDLSEAEAEAEWRGDANGGFMYYRADVPSGRFEDAGYWGEPGGHWRPSIHMPRWASRITLEVTDVRVERLAAMSGDDALAEGIEEVYGPDAPGYRWPGTDDNFDDPREAFERGWNELHQKREDRIFRRGDEVVRSPWVWVVTFRRVEEQRMAAAGGQ
jgi:hypothetical protein